jgi:hypothetical protein
MRRRANSVHYDHDFYVVHLYVNFDIYFDLNLYVHHDDISYFHNLHNVNHRSGFGQFKLQLLKLHFHEHKQHLNLYDPKLGFRIVDYLNHVEHNHRPFDELEPGSPRRNHNHAPHNLNHNHNNDCGARLGLPPNRREWEHQRNTGDRNHASRTKFDVDDRRNECAYDNSCCTNNDCRSSGQFDRVTHYDQYAHRDTDNHRCETDRYGQHAGAWADRGGRNLGTSD